MRGYKGRTHGNIGTYTAGCRCEPCTVARRVYARSQYRRHIERYKRHAVKGRLKYLYGLTLQDYDDMLHCQHGRCAICHRLPHNQRLCVDHNHETGEIRGLLCQKCNGNLGWYEPLVSETHDYLTQNYVDDY